MVCGWCDATSVGAVWVWCDETPVGADWVWCDTTSVGADWVLCDESLLTVPEPASALHVGQSCESDQRRPQPGQRRATQVHLTAGKPLGQRGSPITQELCPYLHMRKCCTPHGHSGVLFGASFGVPLIILAHAHAPSGSYSVQVNSCSCRAPPSQSTKPT